MNWYGFILKNLCWTLIQLLTANCLTMISSNYTMLTEEKCSFWHFRFDAHVDMKIAAITDYIKGSQSAVKLVGGPITEEEYGIAVNKDRPDVLEMLESALAETRADGTYDQVFSKWFSAP